MARRKWRRMALAFTAAEECHHLTAVSVEQVRAAGLTLLAQLLRVQRAMEQLAKLRLVLQSAAKAFGK